MLSRRDLLGKAVVGAAAVAAVGAARTGIAATPPLPVGDATDVPANATDTAATAVPDKLDMLPPDPSAAATSAPAPWELVAPLAAGSMIANGWHLAAMTPVQDGSAAVTLTNERGHATRIHLCRNDGSPQGLVYTRRVDLVVMNQGYGELPTDEHLGQAVAALAHAIAANEATIADGVFAELQPHAERVAAANQVEESR